MYVQLSYISIVAPKKNLIHHTPEECTTPSASTISAPDMIGYASVKCFTVSYLKIHVIDYRPTGTNLISLTPVDINTSNYSKYSKHSVGTKLANDSDKVDADSPPTTTNPKAILIQVIKDSNETIPTILDMIQYNPVPDNHLLE